MKELRSLGQVFKNRKYTTITLLGFASGLPLFLTSRTLQLWMQDAQVDLGAITLFGLVALPYSLKFLWSPLLDRFELPFLGPRRGWLLAMQAGLVLAIAALAFQQPAQNPQVLQVLAINCLILAFLSATQDIAGDAYRTDVLNPLEVETGASVYVLGYRLALFITSSLALILADFIPWSGVYGLMAALMGIGILATLWAPGLQRDRPTAAPFSLQDGVLILGILGLVAGLLIWVIGDPCLQQTCSPYTTRLFAFYWILAGLLITWIAVSFLAPQPPAETLENSTPQTLQDAIIRPFQEFLHRVGLTPACLILLFILLYRLGDSLVGITGNLFLREIGFTRTEIGAIQGGMGFLATTAGVLVGGIVMSRVGVNRALWLFGGLQVLSNLGYYALAISGKDLFLLGIAVSIENFCAGLVTVAMVAFFMKLCHHNFTTTQFALFTSLMAISRDVLSAPAGDLAKLTGWPAFFLWTLVAALPGLLLLPVVAPWRAPAEE